MNRLKWIIKVEGSKWKIKWRKAKLRDKLWHRKKIDVQVIIDAPVVHGLQILGADNHPLDSKKFDVRITINGALDLEDSVAHWNTGNSTLILACSKEEDEEARKEPKLIEQGMTCRNVLCPPPRTRGTVALTTEESVRNI